MKALMIARWTVAKWGRFASRLAVVLLATVLMDASAFGDLIRYARKSVECAVHSYGRNGFDFVGADGRADTIRLSRVQSIEFQSGGRCAVLRSMDGRSITVRVSSFEFGKFKCQTAEGKELSIAASNLKSAEFLAVAEFSTRLKVPFVAQLPDYCGEACVEMVTAYFGRKVNQREVHTACEVRARRGAYSPELERGIRKLGLETADEYMAPGRTDHDFLMDRRALLGAIDRSHPVLLGFWYDHKRKKRPGSWAFDHFVLLVGYDVQKGVFYVHDPARSAYWSVPFEEFVQHRKNNFGSIYSIEFHGFAGEAGRNRK